MIDGLILGILGGAVAGAAVVVGIALAFTISDQFKHYEKGMGWRVEVILSLFFLLAAFSSYHPTAEKSFLWEILAAFLAGMVLMIFSSEFLRDLVAEKTTYDLLMICFRSLLIGVLAGTLMHISHPGTSYTLLGAVGIYQLFSGVAMAFHLLSLGLGMEIALIVSIFVGFLTIIAAIFGSVMTQQFSMIMPVLVSLVAGSMVSRPLLQYLEDAQSNQRKIKLSHNYFSGMMILLIFVIWRELV